ncbi:unnamed protein product [Allacma fusca]|uniref:Uncharacterized protein n=1 Tax=Allacma fusca TaxID=39272 RepID=A0A8J2KX30_9HEXA|nr:unnamed protein product [Allacma fusca]
MHKDLLRIFLAIEVIRSIFTCNVDLIHVLKCILQVPDLNVIGIVLISEYKHQSVFDNERECTIRDAPTRLIVVNGQNNYPLNEEHVGKLGNQMLLSLTVSNNNDLLLRNNTLYFSSNLAYNIFLLQNNDRNLNDDSFMPNIAKAVQRLKNAYFLISDSKFWHIYLRNFKSDNLILAKSFRKFKFSSRSPLRKYPNFQLDTIASADCPICGGTLEIFQQTGVWTDPSTAFFYELAQRVNATLEILPTLGMVHRGRNENGEWDEYMQSVLDETAIVTAYVQGTRETFDHILVTQPYFFDKMCFIYALPQLIKFNPLSRLVNPFNPAVWVSVVTSIFAFFATLQIIISQKNRGDLKKKVNILSTFGATLKPIFDQGSIETKALDRCMSSSLSRSVLGLWLLLLIVLGCAYKSKLVEFIALPKFNPVPTTFEEMAESDYKLLAIFFVDQIEQDLRVKNNTVTNAILKRVVEQNFMEPDCYKGIFEEKAVCIGYSVVFWTVGIQFMVDVKMRPMFKVSSESWFFGYISMGVSLDYPELLEPLNNILASVDNGGLLAKWQKERLRYDLKTGQKNAIKFAEENFLYKGDGSSMNDFNNFSFLLIQVILSAIIFGGMAFALELFMAHKKQRNDFDNRSCLMHLQKLL